MTLYLLKLFCFDQDLSEDELAAREAEAGMQGRTHNLLNQSVAARYRTNGASSRQGLSSSSPADGKDEEGGGSVKAEKKRPKRPRPGGPPASPRAAPSTAAGGGGGGGGAAAAAGLVVERPSARYFYIALEVPKSFTLSRVPIYDGAPNSRTASFSPQSLLKSAVSVNAILGSEQV